MTTDALVEPCMAVVACTSRGFEGTLLQWTGAPLELEIDSVGNVNVDDHTWNPEPPARRPGLWLWIGVVHWAGGGSNYEGDDPAEPELRGTFRALTASEAHRVACGESIVGPGWPPPCSGEVRP